MIKISYLKKFSSELIIILSIVMGIGLTYIPRGYQLIVGIPLFITLIIYTIFTVESKYGKIIFILSAILGLLYLLGITFESKQIQDIIIFACLIVILSILIVPQIHKYKIGVKKGVWTKLDIVSIIILFIMTLLFILEHIYK